jgi:hypothetical protein
MASHIGCRIATGDYRNSQGLAHLKVVSMIEGVRTISAYGILAPQWAQNLSLEDVGAPQLGQFLPDVDSDGAEV